MKVSPSTLLAATLLGLAGSAAIASQPDLDAVKARFAADAPAVRMEYEVAYRFLNIDMSHLGKIVLLTTTGSYQHRVSGRRVPAALIELRMNSYDRRKPPERDRVSIHDRIVAVVTLPELYALVFGKETDEYVNPLFSPPRVSRTISCYDTQSGSLDYAQLDVSTGTVTTNLSNPEALMVLSRQIRPLTEFMMKRYHGLETAPEDGRLSANADGEVIPLIMQTRRETSPAFFDRQRIGSLLVRTVPERPTKARVSEFQGWGIPLQELADRYGDNPLRNAARGALVKSVVPIAVQYDLLLGSIRATLISMGLGDEGTVQLTSAGGKQPARP